MYFPVFVSPARLHCPRNLQLTTHDYRCYRRARLCNRRAPCAALYPLRPAAIVDIFPLLPSRKQIQQNVPPLSQFLDLLIICVILSILFGLLHFPWFLRAIPLAVFALLPTVRAMRRNAQRRDECILIRGEGWIWSEDNGMEVEVRCDETGIVGSGWFDVDLDEGRQSSVCAVCRKKDKNNWEIVGVTWKDELLVAEGVDRNAVNRICALIT